MIKQGNRQNALQEKESSDSRIYERPRIVESAEFETLALACGKQPEGGSPNCVYEPGATLTWS